jgi:hypothetical protein
MKTLAKLTFLIFCFTCFSKTTTAQKASDVLERGQRVKKGNKLFLRYEATEKEMQVAIGQNLNDPAIDFVTLEDSSIFLPDQPKMNCYLLPINPLHFSHKVEEVVVDDPITTAASSGLAAIATGLGNLFSNSEEAGFVGMQKDGKKAKGSAKTKELNALVELQAVLESYLKDDQKKEVVEAFKRLRALTFDTEQATVDSLAKIRASITKIESHFKEFEQKIVAEKAKLDEKETGKSLQSFTSAYIYQRLLEDAVLKKEQQKKRLVQLLAAYDLVAKAQRLASSGGGLPGLKWCVPLKPASAVKGKITTYHITMFTSGYTLNDKEEIVAVVQRDTLKQSFKVRRFQHFVPEVAGGTAFTFFNYFTYTTTSDSTGQQFVADPVENVLRNLKLTTVVNFNYFSPNSPIHPFYQIGVAINTDTPTLLTGVGIRSYSGLKRFSISGGVAFTWLRELDKLKPGDAVNGSDDLENDLKYEFSWPPQPYIGIQYNF